MADNKPNPKPDRKPTGNDPLASLVGNSIDDLLAEAESLASTVAHEVGVPPPQAATPRPTETPQETPPDGIRLPADDAPEAALTVMETILTETQAEGKPDESAHPAPPPVEATEGTESVIEQPAEPPSAAEIDAVVAAMPQVEADAADPSAPVGEEAPQEPATTPSEPVGFEAVVLGSSAPEEAPATPDDQKIIEEEIAAVAGSAAVEPKAPAVPAEPSAKPDARRRSRLRGLARGLKSLPRVIVTSPYWIAVGILWAIDLPFAGMSRAMKDRLGYVGLVTAIMAALAWAMVYTSPAPESPSQTPPAQQRPAKAH